MSAKQSHDTQADVPDIVGGGMKKVLYTLATVRRIGVTKAAKALNSHNACKACGLGMGGQRGGMTNELGEFPAVCNKSVQAQSTDIQPPIPSAIFDHPLTDLQELDGHELEHLGRLGSPLYKAAGDDRYREVTWEWALDRATQRFTECAPERSFFYSSGRSSNEAGFVLQLLARATGTNNVNNCSYYCHQATGVAMQRMLGTGTATVGLNDLVLCDCLFLIGANPASNHPRLMHQLKALRERGGEIVVINPAREAGLVRFSVPKSARSLLAGGTPIATLYLQPRIGGDIALLTGIARAVIESGAEDAVFLAAHTRDYEVFRKHALGPDWASLEENSGVSRADMERAARIFSKSVRTVFAWGMGITQHLHGVSNVEAIADLALLRGMVGKPGAGLLPLRGHSNIQGIGTVGVKPQLGASMLAALESTYAMALPQAPGLNTVECLTAAAAGEMDCALMMGGNLYGASPATQWTRKALETIDFKLFLTTTLNTGHVHGVERGEVLVLPVCARDEEPQPTTQESMFSYLRLSEGGIPRIDAARSEIDVLCELGRRLPAAGAIDFTALTDRAKLRRDMSVIIPGMQELASIDDSRREFHIGGRLLHMPDFPLPGQQAHFRNAALPDAERSKDYPFVLSSVRSEGQFNTIVYEQYDTYRGISNRQSVMMNRADMNALDLRCGDRVSLRSATGEWRNVAVACVNLPRGNLLAYFPEANVLLETAVDPLSHTPSFKSVSVAVERR